MSLQDTLIHSCMRLQVSTGGNRFGSCYVTYLYIAMKNLYVLNVVAQLFILNAFLGTDNLFYGFYILTQVSTTLVHAVVSII